MKIDNEQRKRLRNIHAIATNILNVFDDENETGMQIELNETDGTELITDMVKAMNVVFQKLTGDSKTNLEFISLCNHLIVQDSLEKESKENVQVLKEKNGKPTVIKVGADEYVLRHKNQYQGGERNGKDK